MFFSPSAADTFIANENPSVNAHMVYIPMILFFFLYTLTGAIAKTEKNKQVLDKLQVERERGITVKAQTASLFYQHEGQTYLLNLIDTPVSSDGNDNHISH